MNVVVMTTCASVAVGAIGWLIADAVFGYERRIRRRVEQVSERDISDVGASLFRGSGLTDAASNRFVTRLEELIRQSGWPFTVLQVCWTSFALSAVAAVVAAVMDRHWSMTAGAAVIGLALPWLVIWTARRRRIGQVARQLPEAFDIMRRAVQSGQTVPSALQLASVECRAPLGPELALCCEQQNLGLPYDTTLRDLARRVPITEVQIFAIAMMVQRQFGSNPVEILANISEVIRKRGRLANRVRALTGEGRLQAIVLTILPIGVFFWLVLFRPEYIQTLIDRPRLLGAVAGLQVAGSLWIRQIIRIDY